MEKGKMGSEKAREERKNEESWRRRKGKTTKGRNGKWKWKQGHGKRKEDDLG